VAECFCFYPRVSAFICGSIHRRRREGFGFYPSLITHHRL
jgi:hypothetical protein